MSTMYSRSIAMLEQSVNALHKVGEDDAFLDVACFEAQQAIEFLLKAVLLDNGIAYDKSHDIRFDSGPRHHYKKWYELPRYFGIGVFLFCIDS